MRFVPGSFQLVDKEVGGVGGVPGARGDYEYWSHVQRSEDEVGGRGSGVEIGRVNRSQVEENASRVPGYFLEQQ